MRVPPYRIAEKCSNLFDCEALQQNSMSDCVIILHGICRTRRSMGGLARFLHEGGFTVLNLGYPSRKHPIEKLIDIIEPEIAAISRGPDNRDRKLHFVGFSMGGLVIRAYLQKYRPSLLGRVVMLGTPNRGSEVADLLKDTKFYRWLYGAAGQQLITEQSNFAFCLGCVDYELGVIAGDRSIDPISSRIIGKPNDGKVSIESTMIDGMRDHIVVPTSHTFFPSNRLAWRQTLAFLQHGRFEQTAKP